MRFVGFDPVYDQNSKILILGSFPSVISRKEGFYYGNKQNRFWKMIAKAFDVEIPTSIEQKRNLALANNIALWDIVCECEIKGSMDKDIKNYKVIDISKILDKANIKKILLNGETAYKIFIKNYPYLSSIAVKMPSTSSANVKFDLDAWIKELKNDR